MSQKPPSTHVRALLTWLAIFPLVTLGSFALEPLSAGWPLPLRTLVLTAAVVPLAVYLVVPSLMRARGSLLSRRGGVVPAVAVVPAAELAD
ncbi:antibiotic biosynthesis monooxygenase (ABM) superfamily enzyme [Mycetocola sp. BIGb0189]|uniref:hypothetical protein n=1 Tax=Mycetocola sp. BIGb0189 TaxID=2940604 RepID=UPI0021687329|nr:hypothetical protein [Mycetocola sp. BIGb0189]MCS4275393.1 antibiotic biosynthesis monooxygenase (ABM) superfamily enzyme [Mycetocola sp. BIGb0189]